MSAPSKNTNIVRLPPSRETEFLDNHKLALGRALGIVFEETAHARVAASIVLDRRHLTPAGAVQGGVIMAIADVAGALGATLNVAPGYFTTTIEAKSNFLGKGKGNTLFAESTPIHVGRTTSVWRTKVSRGEDRFALRQIAEVVQTQINLPDALDEATSSVAKSGQADAEEDMVKDGPPVGSGGVVVSLADTRKRQILAGACEVMMRKGYAKASVREIAEACRMPIPTMYKYVRSKEDILFLIYENFLSAFHDRLQASTSGEASPERQFDLALQATIDVFDEYHEHLKLLFRETKSLNASGRQRVYALDLAYIKKWTSLIVALGADRRMSIDAELLANFVHYLTTVWPMRRWAIGKWGFDEVSGALGTFVSAALFGHQKSERKRRSSVTARTRSTGGSGGRKRH